MKKQLKALATIVTAGAILMTFSCKKPTASFSSDKTAAKVGEAITFTNTSTADAQAMWDFGDGSQSTSTQNTISHTYLRKGEYTVSLMVAKKNGKKPSDAPTMVVTISETKSTFTANKTTVATGEIISFTSTTADAEAYDWDFGDGTSGVTANSPNQTHTYSAGGTYIVTLTTWSGNHTVQNTSTITITVNNYGSGSQNQKALLIGNWKLTSHVFTHTFKGNSVPATLTCSGGSYLYGYQPYASTITNSPKIEVTGTSAINTYDGDGNLNSTSGSYSFIDATRMNWAHPILHTNGSTTTSNSITNSTVPFLSGVIWNITTLNSTTLTLTFTKTNSVMNYTTTLCVSPWTSTTETGIDVQTETVTYTKM